MEHLSTLFPTVESELNIVTTNILNISKKEFIYSNQISERLIHILANPGKKTRPAITLLASKLWDKPDNKTSITMATAVELLHIATLLHDDTVDQSDHRRGEATASNLWGKEVAVLLGDYVFASSAIFVCETNNLTLVKNFAETIVELSRGELSEFLDTGNPRINRKSYFERIYNKTASLFKTASQSGAIIGSSDNKGIKAMENFGYNLGIAFQIQDDIIDFESNPDIIGKPSGKDLLKGILTLPSIIFIEDNTSNNPVTDFFSEYPHFSIEKYQNAKKAILDSASIKKSQFIVNEFLKKALLNLETIPNSNHKSSLIDLIHTVHERKK